MAQNKKRLKPSQGQPLRICLVNFENILSIFREKIQFARLYQKKKPLCVTSHLQSLRTRAAEEKKHSQGLKKIDWLRNRTQ